VDVAHGHGQQFRAGPGHKVLHLRRISQPGNGYTGFVRAEGTVLVTGQSPEFRFFDKPVFQKTG
jgi:hypothetical protein